MAEEKAKVVEPAQGACCHILGNILEYAATTERKVAGLQVGHVMDIRTGQHTWSPIVYVLPARGRGKTQRLGLTAVMAFCPFCGTKQPGRNG